MKKCTVKVCKLTVNTALCGIRMCVIRQKTILLVVCLNKFLYPVPPTAIFTAIYRAAVIASPWGCRRRRRFAAHLAAGKFKRGKSDEGLNSASILYGVVKKQRPLGFNPLTATCAAEAEQRRRRWFLSFLAARERKLTSQRRSLHPTDSDSWWTCEGMKKGRSK